MIPKLIEANKETQRLKGLTAEYRKEIEKAGSDNSELIKIRSLIRIMNDKKTLHADALTAQSQLLGILGLEYKDRGLINDRLRTKIELIKEAAKAEVTARTIAEGQKTISDKAIGANTTPEVLEKVVKEFMKAGMPLKEIGGFTNQNTVNKVLGILGKAGAGGLYKGDGKY